MKKILAMIVASIVVLAGPATATDQCASMIVGQIGPAASREKGPTAADHSEKMMDSMAGGGLLSTVDQSEKMVGNNDKKIKVENTNNQKKENI